MEIKHLIEEANEQAQHKRDYVIACDEIHYTDEGMLSFNPYRLPMGDVAFPMTPHALAQVSSRIGGPPPAYLARSPHHLNAHNLNYWQGKVKDGTEWLVRTYKDTCRAVMSSAYTPLGSEEVLAQVNAILTSGNISNPVLVRPYLSPDMMFVKIAVKDVSGKNHAIGFQVSNGEIGNYALAVYPFIQRHKCTNSITLAKDGWSQRHAYVSQAGMKFGLIERIGSALRISAEMVEAISLAEAVEIPNIEQVLDEISKKHKFKLETTQSIFMGTEGQRTLMGIVDGLSYAAHASPNLTPEERVALEGLAGDFFSRVMDFETV